MSSNKNQISTPARNISHTSLPTHPKPKREDESPVSEQSNGDVAESPADEIVADYDVKLDVHVALTNNGGGEGKDEQEAIDTANIISERTRHAKPITGSYILPDEDDEGSDGDVLLCEDGTIASADGDGGEDEDEGADAETVG
ncbi:hypothetical protein F4814DRAFT_452338 [Daldinia grandis]|nr:hypothetical protein F4814DRAFT_452338 [Daldinia grandis]